MQVRGKGGFGARGGADGISGRDSDTVETFAGDEGAEER